jgi:hypothetical protein
MRSLKSLVFVLFCASLALGQGSTLTGSPVVSNGVGQPMAGATVAICSVNPGLFPTSLCSGTNLVTTYTDSTVTVPCTGTLTALNNQGAPSVGSGCSNPGLTDGEGNAVAFALASSAVSWCEYSGSNTVGIEVSVCLFPAAGTGPQIPGYPTSQYGTKGDGSTDDTTAFQNAINACPQTGVTFGCDIYVPAGQYKITGTLNLALLAGVRIHGSGTCGINTCATMIQTNGAIYGWTIGNGTSPNTSGFVIENIGCQDMTGNGLGCFDIKATNNGTIANVACVSYSVGACAELDGGVNFTQWIHFYNTNFWRTKFGFQTASKTASIFVWGGEGNCVNAANTDIITGSIAFDLGFTNHASGTGTASEWSVDSQMQNCQIGIGIWNGGGNHFWGKAIENTKVSRPNASIGVEVAGDATCGGSCSFLANGNVFDGVQITGAGTGFYLTSNVSNTTINTPIFNGTNGVDLVADQTSLTTTRLVVNKRLTGTLANLSTIARSSNTVTGVTVANGALSVLPGTLLTVSGVTGGTTLFNGTFPLLSASTNDTTGVTTMTWTQSGANESGTTNSGGCQGVGSCAVPLSSVLVSGVGSVEVTGDNVTEDIVLNPVTTATNQSLLPTNCQSATARFFFDGVHTQFCDGGNGLVHLAGYTSVFNGGSGNSYTPQPVTVLSGCSGNVNTSGTAITWVSGNGCYFSPSWAANTAIGINFVGYLISSCTSQTACTLTSTAGTQTGVPFNTSGIVGVPPCSTPSSGVCQSGDSQNHIVYTNTGGSTLCLPPPGTANGYPPNYGFTVDYEPGSGSAFMSVTPSGATSLYSIVCRGTASQFRLSSSATSFSINQGTYIYTDGSNWYAVSGNPAVPIDQLQGGIANTTAVTIQGGPFNSGGAGANNGEDIFFKGGLSNSSGGRGGDFGIISGPDSTSGANGSVRVIQTFNAGTSLAGKEGNIVRVCKDVAGTDCQNGVVPSGNTGAVRITVSGTDLLGEIGIVYAGNIAGSPAQVQLAGVFGTDSTLGGVLVETACTAGQYVLIGGAGLDNGAGRCSSSDGTDRIGYALTAVTPCTQVAPCRVGIVIDPR